MGTSKRRLFGITALLLCVAAVAVRADDDPATEQRIAAVRRLGEADNQAAAVALAEVVRTSESPRLREEAARGLGRMKTERAPSLLTELIVDGGPQSVRLELARSMLRQEGGLDRLAHRLATRRDDELGRALLVTALAHADDDASRQALEHLSISDDATQRVAAWRALGKRPDGGALTHALAVIALAERTDVDTLVAALDTLFDARHEPLEDAEDDLNRLQGNAAESVSARATHLLARLAWLRDMAERNRVRGTEYARPGPDPTEPRFNRPAVDEVWSFDTTASQRGTHFRALKDSVAERIRATFDAGADVRVGMVLYRDDLRDANQRRTSYRTKTLPLTHDTARIWQFLDAASAGGVDTHGQCVSAALHEGLGRMNWRADARRRMHVVGQNLLDRPQLCGRIAKLYTGHDGTALRLYTEQRDSDPLRALAAAAGTTLERFP